MKTPALPQGFVLRAAALGATLALALAACSPAPAQRDQPLVGRWDMVVGTGAASYPSWLGVEVSGYRTLVGRYVGGGGSARPISKIDFSGGHFHFTVPVQWEQGPNDLVFDGDVQGDRLTGTLVTDTGRKLSWTAVRAPALNSDREPRWGKPIALFNGKDLTGWQPRNPNRPNGWVVRNGILVNDRPGNDILTTQQFTDFKLHAEFQCPRGSNSGIYLRGRYEAQIEDDHGREPESHGMGGIYGFLTPRINASRPADDWQTYDLTLVGRRVTVELNGEKVIDRQIIPGITGGALDSREGEPGPVLIQGDHGRVDFRRIMLTPELKE